MTESIGQQLRKAREASHLSLEQASRTTRIKMHYLQALEADAFEKLPSRVQQRGFLRTYAELLNLPVEPLLAQLDGEVSPPAVSAPGAGKTAAPETFSGESIASPSETSAVYSDSNAILKELGNTLRRQREALGLTLQDVEQQTHLKEHYLKALEGGALEDLPSPVQGRGMLYNYANFLGLEPDLVLLRYAEGLQARQKANQERQAQSIARSSGRKRSAQTGSSLAMPKILQRIFTSGLWTGGLIVAFLIGFVIWAALRIAQIQAEQEPTATPLSIAEILAPDTPTWTASPSPEITLATPEAPVLDETEAIMGTSAPLAVEVTATEPPTPAFPVAESGKIQLYLVARQRAWTRVVVDGKVQLEGRVLPGSAYLFTGENRIELLTGNGAALQVFLNRQDLGLLGIYGEVAQRIFTSEGMLTPTPAVSPTPTVTPTPATTQTPAGTGTPSLNTPTSTEILP